MFDLELNLFDAQSEATPIAAPEEAQNAADAQPQKTNETTPETVDRDAQFEKLIKGEYKDQFERRIKDNLKRRFKESSDLRQKVSQSDEIISMLKIKYGIVSDDFDKIAEAVKNDDGYLKQEAAKKGMESDTLQKMRYLEFENESMKNQIRRGLEERKMQKEINSWIKDANEIIETYPDFDLEKEVENPSFAKMLKNGVSLKDAFFASHRDEILDNLKKKISEETSVKITDSIRAKGIRPNENGTDSKSTAILKTDVSKLTPKQRAEIAARVRNGEEISF